MFYSISYKPSQSHNMNSAEHIFFYITFRIQRFLFKLRVNALPFSMLLEFLGIKIFHGSNIDASDFPTISLILYYQVGVNSKCRFCLISKRFYSHSSTSKSKRFAQVAQKYKVYSIYFTCLLENSRSNSSKFYSLLDFEG